MSKHNFPTTIEGLDSYLFLAVAWLLENATRLGLDTATVNALTSLYGDDATAGSYVYCKAKYDSTAGRKDSVVSKNLSTISEKIKKKLMAIYADIPASKWTDEDRLTLNRKTGLSHQPSKPVNSIQALCYLNVKPFPNGLFKMFCHEEQNSKKGKVPDEANGFELAWAIVESEIRPIGEMADKVKKTCVSPDQDTYRSLFTKSTEEFQVSYEYAGFYLVCWARWINSHYPDLSGKWSERHVHMINVA